MRLLARARGPRAAIVVYACSLGSGTLALLPVPFVDTAAAAGTPALTVAWWLWAVLTPWWVSRMLSEDRGDAAVILAAQAGATPQEAVLAQLAAAFIFAGELALVSLPVGVVAYASGRATARDVAAAAAELAALGALAIVVTFHCSLRAERRLSWWMAATAIILIVAASFPHAAAVLGRGAAASLVAVAAAALGTALPIRARRELLYLAS
jgi:hypothetical protein